MTLTLSEDIVYESTVLVEKLVLKYKIPQHQAIVFAFAGLELLARTNSLHIGEVRTSVQSFLERLHREDSEL